MTDDIDRELYAELRRKRRRGIVLGLVLVGVSIAPCVVIANIIRGETEQHDAYREEHSHTGSAEQLAVVDTAAAALEAQASRRQAAWRSALAGAGDLGLSTERCRPPPHEATPYQASSGAVPDEPAALTSGREGLESVRARLGHQTTEEWVEEAVEEARTIGSDAHWGREIVVFIDQRIAPRVDTTIPSFPSYEPGQMHGRAYLYDYASEAIVCAAALDYVQNGDIDFTTDIMDQGTDAFLAAQDDFDRGLQPAVRSMSWRTAARVALEEAAEVAEE